MSITGESKGSIAPLRGAIVVLISRSKTEPIVWGVIIIMSTMDGMR